MKKNLLRTLSFILLGCLLFVAGCREENLLLENENSNNQLKVTILTQEQLNKETQLLQRISEYKKNIRSTNNLLSKTVSNSILDDAIISTKRVVRIENNGNTTYTFPIFRTYQSEKIENLVLKKNENGSFSGVLMQYNTTKEEKDKYKRGEYVDLMKKLEVFPVDNIQINIASRTKSLSMGCVTIEYETGMCSENLHESGEANVGECTAETGPPPIQIVSITVNCSGGDDGGTGSTTGGNPYPSIEPGGGFTTFPFVSLGYEYFATEDLRDPNYVLYNQVGSFFNSLGSSINTLRNENPDLFYYSYFYFKDNGINTTTKTFISQRLTGLNNWYTKANSTNWNINNQFFLNWAFWHLVVEDPTQTWEEFYNLFIATPCDKIKSLLAKTEVQAKITELKNQSTLGDEKGVMFKLDGTPSETISGGAHSVNFGDKTGYAGGYHNHTPTGIPMLSPNDIDQLLGFARAQPTSNSQNLYNAYLGMVAPNGMHYVIWFNGTYEDAVKTFSQVEINNYKTDFRELEKNLTDEAKNGMTYMNGDGSINNLGVEKLFFETLKNMGLEGKVNLQRIESDGTVKTIGLNSNNQPISTTCS